MLSKTIHLKPLLILIVIVISLMILNGALFAIILSFGVASIALNYRRITHDKNERILVFLNFFMSVCILAIPLTFLSYINPLPFSLISIAMSVGAGVLLFRIYAHQKFSDMHLEFNHAQVGLNFFNNILLFLCIISGGMGYEYSNFTAILFVYFGFSLFYQSMLVFYKKQFCYKPIGIMFLIFAISMMSICFVSLDVKTFFVNFAICGLYYAMMIAFNVLARSGKIFAATVNIFEKEQKTQEQAIRDFMKIVDFQDFWKSKIISASCIIENIIHDHHDKSIKNHDVYGRETKIIVIEQKTGKSCTKGICGITLPHKMKIFTKDLSAHQKMEILRA